MTSNLKQPELFSNSNQITNRHSDHLTIWSHITSSLLHTWINNSNSHSKLLIIDSRDATEFNKLHIKNSINLPESKIISHQLKTDKISISELLLKYSSIDLISSDTHELNLVVYDHNSEHTNQLDFEKSFTIVLLKKLAQKYKSVSILIGGFVNFAQMYPNSCQSSSSLLTALCSSSAIFLAPMLSITSESPIRDDQQQVNANAKIVRLNHSLSTHGIDLCSSSTAVKTPVNYLCSPQDESQPIREPTQILDFLYLGSQEDALSKSTMEALSITNVLNVSITCPKPEFISDAHFLRIPVNDGHAAKILPFFDVAYRFIEKCRKSKCKVIIHCLAGISRSPTLAIAYLMKHLNLKSDEAYKMVKEKRKTISPNFNFLGQLYEYEKHQQGASLNELKNDEQKSTESFLKFEKKSHSNLNQLLKPSSSTQDSSQPTPSKLSLSQRKKQFIFNFSHPSSSSSSSLVSPSQAFSNFSLNSPTIDQQQSINSKQNIIKSFACNSLKDILASQHQQSPSSNFAIPNIVMRRPNNVQETGSVNILKRPSSILLGFSNNPSINSHETRPNELSRTLSNTSAGSTSSSCSTCSNQSTSSNQSCSNCILTPNQYQKKLKLSPIQDRIVLSSFQHEEDRMVSPRLNRTKLEFVFTNNSLSCAGVGGAGVNATSPLTPNSLMNTGNLVYSFNQKLVNDAKVFRQSGSLREELRDEVVSEGDGEENEENNENNSVFGLSTNITKSSSSSSSSNKNSLHGSIEAMIEVS